MSHFLDANGLCTNNDTVTTLLGFQLPNVKYDNLRMCLNEISTEIARPIVPGFNKRSMGFHIFYKQHEIISLKDAYEYPWPK